MASKLSLAKATAALRGRSDVRDRPSPSAVRSTRARYDRSRSSTPGSEAEVPAKSTKNCPNPECDGTETAEDGGQVICTECGAVVSDKQLTQDVQFGEAANGQAIVQGVHVGEGQETARPAPGSSRVMGGTASKEIAISDARREMTRLAANPGWGIRQSDVEKAERVFKLAYNYGHTKGRDRIHICAVCLYIAVRQRPDEEPTLMLIDFADFVKVSVFYLGRLYTELCQEIRIHHEATVYQIRPELLAHRFCEELGFGDDTFRIATEAINIIKRMNRDWLVRGRRPSGIVGAAVILAARMNNYRRTVRELVYTAKVCEYTITRRLDEFKCTPVSKLTVNEVRQKNWDQAAPEPVGPPAMYPNAFKIIKQKKRKRLNAQGLEDGVETENASDNGGVQGTDGSIPASPSEMQAVAAVDRRKRRRSSGNHSTDRTQAEIDRQAMPPPSSTAQLNIDPELLRASTRALKDIGDVENVSKLTQKRTKTRAANDEDDADDEENSTVGKRTRRRKRQARPLPEPSEEVLADEEQLEADMNAHLKDVDMLSHTVPAHEESEDAVAPPDMQETADTPRANTENITEDQEKDIEEDFLQQYLGVFHRKRDNEEDEDEVDEREEDLPPNEQWTSQNHEDIHNAYKETVKHSRELLAKYPITTADLLAKIPSSEEISDSEFADDPDVNEMLLGDEDVNIKEALWISKYGKHLKERHLKKVQRLIDEENGNVKQPRKRNVKKPRPGDDSGYARDGEGRVASGWKGVIKATFEHRGSNKLNYQAIGKILDDESPSSASGTASRAASTAPSLTGSTTSRQATPSRTAKPVRMARIPKDGKVPAYLATPPSSAMSVSKTAPSKKGDSVVSGRETRSTRRSERNIRDGEEEADDHVQSATQEQEDDEEEEEGEEPVEEIEEEGDESDDDEDDDDQVPDMSNVSEAVLNRMNAGMSYEEAVAADTDRGF